MSAQAHNLSISTSPSILRNSSELLGRILLSTLFLISGIGKITAYSATAGYMESTGVPGILLPLVILTEVGGAVAIMVGWKTRVIATLLAGFTLVTALIFHHDLGDQNQVIHFMKNVAIAGGFLMLAANGPGRYSLDAHGTRYAAHASP